MRDWRKPWIENIKIAVFIKPENNMNKKQLEELVGHKRPKRHKFGAIRTVCNLGHKHPSKAEAMHCWALQAQMKANLITHLVWETVYPLIVNGIFICNHKPDFSYSCKIKGKCVDEVKGFKTADWVLKSKLFQALYPHIKYRVIGG